MDEQDESKSNDLNIQTSDNIKEIGTSINIALDNFTSEDLYNFVLLLDGISAAIKNKHLPKEPCENPLSKLKLSGKSWADMIYEQPHDTSNDSNVRHENDTTPDLPLSNIQEGSGINNKRVFNDSNSNMNVPNNKSKLQFVLNANYKYILECPHGNQCNFQEIYEDDIGRRRKCQYIHDENDCRLGSRFCSDMVQCGKIHGCTRLTCDYSEDGPKYGGRFPCRKLFSCPYYHSDREYEKWVNMGYYDRWQKDPKKYINPTNFRNY